jgi:hypothetical protein
VPPDVVIVVEPDIGPRDVVWIYPSGRWVERFAIPPEAWEQLKKDIKNGLYDT